MNREQQSNLRFVLALATAQIASDTNATGIDGSGFDSVLHKVAFGATVDAGTTIKIQESDDNVAFTDVIADEVVSDVSLADQNVAGYNANGIYTFAYVGSKQYSRVVIVTAGATDVGAEAVKANANFCGVGQNAAQ